MNEKEYLEKRVDNQINWYSNKSSTNKKLHYWTKGLMIIFSIAIPFVAGINDQDAYPLNLALGMLGGLVAILTGLSALLKFQEKWAEYRITAEGLKREKHVYLT